MSRLRPSAWQLAVTVGYKSYREDFGCQRPMWGFCDYPMVDGDQLICTPAGLLASIVGLDKNTGEILWQSDRLTEKETSYSAIVSMKVRRIPRSPGNDFI